MSSFGAGGRGKTTAQAVVILPSTKSSKRDFVPPFDYRYEFLSGNRPEVTRDTCGKWLYYGCLKSEKHGFPIAAGQRDLSGGSAHAHDVVEAVRKSCGKLDCPVCYEKAAAKQALKIENRISQFKWAGRKETKYYHWVASPPESDVARYDERQLRRKAVKILKEAGVAGGCNIFHHLRRYNDNDLREDIAEGSSWKTAPAAWHFSPHFHVIGVGFTSKQKVLHVFNKYGWVVKNLGQRKSVRSTALYQLSHAYIPKKGHAVTWFGVMAYNNKSFKPKPLPKEKERVCPVCGSEMQKVKPVDSEAEDIVRSKISEEGIYRFKHGLFEVIESQKPPWKKSGG